jgi:hypothetical protein
MKTCAVDHFFVMFLHDVFYHIVPALRLFFKVPKINFTYFCRASKRASFHKKIFSLKY